MIPFVDAVISSDTDMLTVIAFFKTLDSVGTG